MADFYPELIKAEAVRAVEAFINSQIPLSDSIADTAKARGLNPEQIKRLIEAANQICYLKLQTMTADRTFEFPLADYKIVMSKVIELEPTMDKQASEGHRDSPLAIVSGRKGMTKEASTHEWSNVDLVKEASDQDKAVLLYRTIQREVSHLEKIASDCDIMVESLFSATNSAKKDPEFLDKLAHVADEADYKAIVKFAAVDPSAATGETIFKEADLKEVRGLCDMYKEAKTLVSSKDELSAKLEKAAHILDNMLEKEAFLGAAAKMIGRGINKVVAGAAKATAKGGYKTGKAVAASPVAGAGALGAVDYAGNPKNINVKQRV